jgi:hypothetical protein
MQVGITKAALVLLAVYAALLSGCGDGEAQKQMQERDNIRTLARMYGQFMSGHRGVGPKNEAEFKQYLESRKGELAGEQITDINTLFISNRDEKPYVVVYGLGQPAAMTPTGRVIAYEQQGVDGKRMVAYETMAADELDEERFKSVVKK